MVFSSRSSITTSTLFPVSGGGVKPRQLGGTHFDICHSAFNAQATPEDSSCRLNIQPIQTRPACVPPVPNGKDLSRELARLSRLLHPSRGEDDV